jgi:hypothetical protein
VAAITTPAAPPVIALATTTPAAKAVIAFTSPDELREQIKFETVKWAGTDVADAKTPRMDEARQ